MNRFDRLLKITLVLAGGFACAPGADAPPANDMRGAGGVTGTSGAGTGGGLSGAPHPAGNGAAHAGGGGFAGTGGTPGASGAGTGGAAAGAGGMFGGSMNAGAGNGGGPESAGSGGAQAGSSGAGAGGSAGAGGMDDPRGAAEVLDGLAILKPCVSSFRPSGNANNAGDCCCEELAANENQHITRQFGGDANVTYDVTLRVAGVAERYWYSGGMLDANMLFYRGGLPTIHGAAPNDNLRPGQGACKVHPPETDGQFALPFTVPAEIRPADGCYNGFNIFAMTVSSPKQSYYLNPTTEFDGVDRQPHSVYRTDYTVTIPISGQARLDFYTIDGDHHQVTNNGTMRVSDVTTPQPYNGNFLEFTVVNVTRAN